MGRALRGERSLSLRPLAVIAIVAVALLPAALVFGPTIDRWFDSFRAASHAPALIGVVVAALLAVDIAAPIPSTVVIAVAGATLGTITGGAVAFVGLMIGCIMGYALAGRLSQRLSDRRIAAVQRFRHPVLAVAVTRPIPLLGESTVIAAGLARVDRRAFVAACVAANFVFAFVVAALPGRFS